MSIAPLADNTPNTPIPTADHETAAPPAHEAPIDAEDRERDKGDTLITICLAASFGALCLGFGDLINNDRAATVLKLGEVMRRYIYSGFESGGLWALVLLALLGAGVCWIHQPKTRIDAFTRGFSVFAILAVVTPFHREATQQSALASPSGASVIARNQEPLSAAVVLAFMQVQREEAHDRVQVSPEIRQPESNDKKVALVWLKSDAGSIDKTLVTIRDPKTAEILSSKSVMGNNFSFSSDIGEYLVEVEVLGFRRTSFTIKLTDKEVGYSVPMTDSIFPLSWQRLVGSKEVNPKKIDLAVNKPPF